jgi:2,3-bisphosphoglycerate-independent phosphoglycerate mutase
VKDLKYAVVIVSGLSDVPAEHLGGKTPLEAAKTPHMDYISSHGRIGLVEKLVEDVSAGSEKALLSLLGYDTARHPIRRGPLEAEGLGVELSEEDLALRLNFVSTFNGLLMDHNAGHIGNAEAATLIKMLKARLGDEKTLFYSGMGYRNVLVLRGGADYEFNTVPPHEALHQPVIDFMPYGRDAAVIRDLMERAHDELADHDINRVRVDLGENPADRIWLWGEGGPFDLPPFDNLVPLKSCAISASPLVKGIASKIGLKHIDVPGATGYLDSDFEAKARNALAALCDCDLAMIYTGAVNEVSHAGDLEAKVQAIEEIDSRLFGPLLKGLKNFDKWRIMVTSDHITPAAEVNPLNWPVPMAFCGHEVDAIRGYPFHEKSAKGSDLFVERGQDLMEFFLGVPRPKPKKD